MDTDLMAMSVLILSAVAQVSICAAYVLGSYVQAYFEQKTENLHTQVNAILDDMPSEQRLRILKDIRARLME